MTNKKPLGILFIVLAVLLSLALVAQFPAILAAILVIGDKTADADQLGYAIGYIIGWVIMGVGAMFLWKYGIRWSKKQVNQG